MNLSTTIRRFSVFLFGLGLIALPAVAQQIDSTKLGGMEFREIGPAAMSGRVTTIEAVPSDPGIIYAGTASGGLWKSTSGGTDWEPIFEDQPVHSIGNIALDPNNPDVIWVGTGEGNPRNTQNAGNGVYKSIDGGRSWQHLGLSETRNIHRVLVDPTNSEVAYVGAQGAAWEPTPQRGVYKTTDGGATWEKVLFVNDTTGVADLVMDPENPNKLIAAMWQFQRWPWFFDSGGPGSGLYITYDGGENWTELTPDDGLPPKPWGRIGLAIAPSDPDRVYALVESNDNALYRSDDGGHTWRRINTKEGIGGRPFYYADLRVDPEDPNRVYSLHGGLTMSEDGGRSFETVGRFRAVHPDHHAMWINPKDPTLVMDGNDGGLYISRDRAQTWSFADKLPVGQFYHINVDMDVPYHVYGGMQDNGSWRGPNTVWRYGGIRDAFWQEVAFGDGFDVTPDPQNSMRGFAMSQGGSLVHYDLETGTQEFVRPEHSEKDVQLRFNWNAALAQDPFDPATIYYGSQFLHKSTDRGDSWTIISPDLTTDNPEWQRQLESGGLTYDVTEAENFTTIVSIAPSPRQRGVIWVGTDDGNVQVTRDGGETWTNVVDNIDGVPENTWVPQIRASKYRAGEAFVVFDNHRRNDWTPYLYHTTDYGQSWERLVDEDDVRGYTLSFVQDPVEPDLMFVGTGFGLYFSIDGGDTWNQWTNEYPTASTRDMAIHPREYDLVVATFGRAIHILDDIRPLRALARDGTDLLDEPLHVFDAPDAYLADYQQPPGARFRGNEEFNGENQPYGALLSFSVNPPEEEGDNSSSEGVGKDDREVTVKIVDAEGDTIRTFNEDVEPGINRVTWGLRRKGVRDPDDEPPEREDAPEPRGPRVLPGTYTAVIRYGDHVDSTSVTVKMDPRIDVSMADLQARQDMILRLMDDTRTTTEAVDRLREARTTIDRVNEQIEDREGESVEDVREQGKALKDSLQTLVELINPKEVQGIRRDPTIVSARLGQASRYLQSSYEAPRQVDRRAVDHAEEDLREALDAINQFFQTEWPDYQRAVEALDLSLFEDYDPISLEGQ